MKYKVLKNILVPRDVRTGPDGIPKGCVRAEAAPMYYPGDIVDLDPQPVLEREGFLERVKDDGDRKKKKGVDDA
jgi:hypothetical protein